MPEHEPYTVEQGIGVHLSFQPDKRVGKFLKDLPQRVGEAFMPEDVHATIFYPEELVCAGLGRVEREKLPEAAHAITNAINGMDIEGQQIETVPGILRPYKKFYGIELLDEDDFLSGIRAAGSGIIEEVTGVKLRTYLDTYHASVARRRPSDGRRSPLKYQRHFPENFVAGGFGVAIRSVAPNEAQPQCYVRGMYRADPHRMYG